MQLCSSSLYSDVGDSAVFGKYFLFKPLCAWLVAVQIIAFLFLDWGRLVTLWFNFHKEPRHTSVTCLHKDI